MASPIDPLPVLLLAALALTMTLLVDMFRLRRRRKRLIGQLTCELVSRGLIAILLASTHTLAAGSLPPARTQASIMPTAVPAPRAGNEPAPVLPPLHVPGSREVVIHRPSSAA